MFYVFIKDLLYQKSEFCNYACRSTFYTSESSVRQVKETLQTTFTNIKMVLKI